MKKNQSGFGLTGIILILVAVGTIGMVSWILSNEPNPKPDSSSRSAAATSSDSTSASSNKLYGTQQKPNRLEVKEWRIALVPAIQLPDVSYAIKSNEYGRDNALLTFKEIPECSGYYKISRVEESKADSSNTDGDYVPSTAARVDGYLYWMSHGQAGCSSNTDKQNQLAKELFGETQDTFRIVAL